MSSDSAKPDTAVASQVASLATASSLSSSIIIESIIQEFLLFWSLKKEKKKLFNSSNLSKLVWWELFKMDDQYFTFEIYCKVSHFWFSHPVKMRLLLNISTCHLFMCNVVTAQQRRVEERREQVWWLQCDEIFSEIITGVRRILSHPRGRERKGKKMSRSPAKHNWIHMMWKEHYSLILITLNCSAFMKGSACKLIEFRRG